MLADIVLKNLQTEGILSDSRFSRLVVAYSGGIDSTVLLHILTGLRERFGLEVLAAYYHHGWRGAPPEELPLLHRNCTAFRLPWVILRPERNLPKTESAGREARYRALTRLAEDWDADAVVTAHQADDQIETILFRVLRGTGTDGLAGIQKKLVLQPSFGAPIPILRPMLDIYREGIRRYAAEHALEFFEDPTNTDPRYSRNMVRSEILPYLQSRFPYVKRSVLRLGEVVEGDQQIINDKLEEIWARIYHPAEVPSASPAPGRKPRSAALDALQFNQLGRPYQRRIIKRFLLAHHHEIDFQTIDEVIDFIEGNNRKNLSAALRSLEKDPYGKGRFLSVYKNRITILEGPERTDAQTLSRLTEPVQLLVPGETPFPHSQCSLRILEMTEEDMSFLKQGTGLLRPQDSCEIAVDLSAFAEEKLELRTRRPGDRIQPFGMKVPVRLKNFFINRGIPRFDRDRIPLIACGNEILWAVGVGISESLRVVDKPTHLMAVQELPSV